MVVGEVRGRINDDEMKKNIYGTKNKEVVEKFNYLGYLQKR